MTSKQSKIIIIGLGNAGTAYENTYHNAGKLMVNRLSKILGGGTAFRKKGFSGESISGASADLISVNLAGYMNESGKHAKLAMKSFGTKPGSLIVVHDDGDLEIGKWKISFGRGSAGHNGVQSVIDALGTKNFWRLRIGIRPKAGLFAGAPRKKAGEFVLKKISQSDKHMMESAFEKAINRILAGNFSLISS
ncbi:MAG: peptidyl-tRNA hydrolase [Candidatus Liptonbacteria bacterium]|nr:peptidyl-tRNA hydrolase [Candidatus Liptonbacteria bacterium]